MKSKLSPAPKKAAKAAPLKANRVSMTDCAGPGGTEKSVSIRKISNGFVVTESSWSPGGKYKSTETFSTKPPTVQVEPTKSRK